MQVYVQKRASETMKLFDHAEFDEYGIEIICKLLHCIFKFKKIQKTHFLKALYINEDNRTVPIDREALQNKRIMQN